MPTGPIHRYRALVEAGDLVLDPAQALAVEALQVLHGRLAGYVPGRDKGGLRGFLRIGKPDPAPRGLYMFGGVGRGKSMLMDMFFESAPVSAKRRVHFHAFMNEAQDAIHEQRGLIKQGVANGDDPIPPVADAIADAATLICFDEFQVTDIADAMILGRLFERLFARGVVVVSTSNTAPADLYAGGLNRDLFLPFIALLTDHMDVLHLEASRDYRLDRLRAEPIYHTPLGKAVDEAMDNAWREAISGRNEHAETVEVMGRTFEVARAAGTAARFSFSELCDEPLGARDYLALAERYDMVFIDNIRVLSADERNPARRLILLIDALYEADTLVFFSAAAEPSELVTHGLEADAFQRTASRIEEMRSADYRERAMERDRDRALRPPT